MVLGPDHPQIAPTRLRRADSSAWPPNTRPSPVRACDDRRTGIMLEVVGVVARPGAAGAKRRATAAPPVPRTIPLPRRSRRPLLTIVGRSADANHRVEHHSRAGPRPTIRSLPLTDCEKVLSHVGPDRRQKKTHQQGSTAAIENATIEVSSAVPRARSARPSSSLIAVP